MIVTRPSLPWRRRMACALLVLAAACSGKAAGRDTDDAADAADSTSTSRLVAGGHGEAVIALDSGDVQRLDLATVVLRASSWSASNDLPGVVVAEPERITTLRSALGGRLVVEDGMQWPTYGSAVAAGTIVGRVADAKPLQLARGGTVSRIGAQPGEIVEAGQVLLEITDYSHPLVKVAWLDARGDAPPTSLMLKVPGGASVAARIVGEAPVADEASRAPAFLYRADRAWSGARPGELVRAAWSTGRAVRGVEVPSSAVVQWDGLMWAFIETSPGKYARRAVANDRALDRGWFADRGWAAGDRVVVRGAQALLSEEFRSRITVGDETGD